MPVTQVSMAKQMKLLLLSALVSGTLAYNGTSQWHDTCNFFTGGSCYLFGCYSSHGEGAFCGKLGRTGPGCYCRAGYCAVEGTCVKVPCTHPDTDECVSDAADTCRTTGSLLGRFYATAPTSFKVDSYSIRTPQCLCTGGSCFVDNECKIANCPTPPTRLKLVPYNMQTLLLSLAVCVLLGGVYCCLGSYVRSCFQAVAAKLFPKYAADARETTPYICLE